MPTPPTTKQKQSAVHSTQRRLASGPGSRGYNGGGKTCVGPASKIMAQYRQMGGAPRQQKGLIRRRPGGR